MQVKRTMTYTFIEFVNHELKRKEWKPVDLAKEMGVSESTVSRWLNEKKPTIPDLPQLMGLSLALSVGLETLASYLHPSIRFYASNLSASGRLLGERFDKLPDDIQTSILLVMEEFTE